MLLFVPRYRHDRDFHLQCFDFIRPFVLTVHFPQKPALRIGVLGEYLARRYVCAHGYRHIVNNYRCRSGEIDLITVKNNLLLFIEVKSRLYPTGTHGLLRITPQKQKRILRTAEHFLHQHATMANFDVRFDAILVQLAPLSIAWQTNLFCPNNSW